MTTLVRRPARPAAAVLLMLLIALAWSLLEATPAHVGVGVVDRDLLEEGIDRSAQGRQSRHRAPEILLLDGLERARFGLVEHHHQPVSRRGDYENAARNRGHPPPALTPAARPELRWYRAGVGRRGLGLSRRWRRGSAGIFPLLSRREACLRREVDAAVRAELRASGKLATLWAYALVRFGHGRRNRKGARIGTQAPPVCR